MLRFLLVLSAVLLGACQITNPKDPIQGTYVLRTVTGQKVPIEQIFAGSVQLSEGNRFLMQITYPYLGLVLTDSLFADYIVRSDSVIVYLPQQRVILLHSGRTLTTQWNIGEAIFEKP